MVKVKYKCELEIEMNFPEGTPGIMSFEHMKGEMERLEDVLTEVLHDEIVYKEYGKIKIKTIEKEIWEE
jgi:hypothetical protein